jgi:phosphoribosylanthranilate isomerase
VQGTTRPRIKICCIGDVEEAWLAIRHGAEAIGLVSEMPSGPGRIPERLIAEVAAAVPPGVTSFLLTSRQSVSDMPVKQLGGTGRLHDWQISRRIREALSVPVFLAGGLRADNVAEAIAAVKPFAVDVCSGIRTAGRLDAAKLEAFVQAVRGAA